MSEQNAKCEKCGEGVSEKVEAYSRDHFDNHVYCYKCQKNVRGDEDTGAWTYGKPENAEEEKKATSEAAAIDVKSTEDEELEEYDSEFTTELSKELDKKIIALVTGMSRHDTGGFYAWLKTVYGVDDLETLNIEQKEAVLNEAVLNETEKMVEGKESEKIVDVSENGNKTVEIDEGTFSFQERDDGKLSCSDAKGNVYVLNITVPDCSCSQFQKDKSKQCPHLKAAAVGGFLPSEPKKETEKAVEPDIADSSDKEVQKKIDIDWNKIPVQMLIPKLRKALEYSCEKTVADGIYHVTKSEEDSVYTVSVNSCQCEDWIRVGNSVNPCKHMIRVKYSDDEIRATLKDLGAGELPMKRKERKEVMPFSERDTNSDMCITNITPRLAEIGKIKIGRKGETKTKTGFLLPEKWDHFEIATLVKDDEGRLEIDNEMTAKIGKNCKALDVELCYDSPVMNMPNFYALLSEGKIMCRGNGVVATKTKEDESKEEVVCKPRECSAYKNKKCKLHGRLSVILSASNRLGGVYVFRTSGFNSIRNIMSSMGFFRGITGGVLGGIPLRLTLLPMTVKPQGVTRNVKIYAVNLEYTGSPAELKNAAMKEIQRRMTLGVDMVQTEKEDKDLLQAQVIEEAEEEAKAEEFVSEGE
ncbi:unnamed protein product [marine sediment metagenome]|uniref:SWIM-type domain-containing protein n=1 Tax=marine sediment metagenome TaxID=412755 RepID=X1EY02_9ZZZZ